MPTTILATSDGPVKTAKMHLTEQLQALQQTRPTIRPQAWRILTKTVELTVDLDANYLTCFWKLETLSSQFARQRLVERTTNPELVRFFQIELRELVAEDAHYLAEAAALWHELKTRLTAQLNTPTHLPLKL